MEKLVPKLRFPEFEGEWEKEIIGNIFNVNAGGDISKENVSTFKTNEYKYPIYANAAENKGLYGYSNIYKVDSNVITVAGRGVNIGIAHARNHKFYPIVRLLVLKPKKNQDIYFFEYQLNNLNLHKESTGVPQLTAPQISNYSIVFPALSEQQKIASFLTSVDARIALLEKQKQGLETYKKGVMQQIFSQQLRFKDDKGKDFPDWEEKKLGEVCKLQGGYAFKSNEFQENGIPVIRISNISNQTNYIDLNSLVYYKKIDKDESFTIKKGDLIIAMSGATTGKSSIYNLENTAYLNQRVGLFKSLTKELDYIFLIQFIFSDFFKKQLDSVLVAGAQPNISSKDIESLFIPFPKKEEQQKIASFLSAIDVRIEVVSKQIEQSKVFKKGLLQQMFV